ncbi:MAG: 4-hydroxy-tetrahydrodipicolinate synthase [Xanthomonadaceae bacterium]|nr:4-hydroxy-tetrahydrodipicolinate synthase [Xanthomonadaceae bacterium]
MSDKLPQGSIVALISPMHEDGALDREAWLRLLKRHLSAGTCGVVVGGTTGESATLNAAERDWMLEAALDTLSGRCSVIAGTGSASTEAAIAQSTRAADLGADAVLVVTPFYNRPPQRGLERHYRAIADTCAAPVILYNVPSRTAVDLDPGTTIALAGHPNIVAIKEAVADMERVRTLRAAGVMVYSGDDPSAAQAIEQGASGVISVAANVVPEQIAELCRLALAGEFKQARTLNRSLESLYAFLSVEPNPIPVKWMLAEIGCIGPGIRLPLVPLASHFHEAGSMLLRTLNANTSVPESSEVFNET